jgi:hypothetical protein
LAHSFKGISLWSVGSIAFGLSEVRHHAVCCKANLLTWWQPGSVCGGGVGERTRHVIDPSMDPSDLQ